MRTFVANVIGFVVALPAMVAFETAFRVSKMLPQPWGYGPKGRSGDVNP